MSTQNYDPDLFVKALQDNGDFIPNSCIVGTTKIEDNNTDPFFILLKNAYKAFDFKFDMDNKCKKVQITLLNAMYTQKMGVVSFNRSVLRSVLRSDVNWSQSEGFSNDDGYSTIIAFLSKNGVFNVLKYGNKDKPGAVLIELVKKEFLQFFQDVNIQKQKIDSLSVWDRNSSMITRKSKKKVDSDQRTDQSSDQAVFSSDPKTDPTIYNILSTKVERQNTTSSPISEKEAEEVPLRKIIPEVKDIFEKHTVPEMNEKSNIIGASVKITDYFEKIESSYVNHKAWDNLSQPHKKMVRSKFNELIKNLKVDRKSYPKDIPDRVHSCLEYISQNGPVIKKEAYELMIRESFDDVAHIPQMKQVRDKYLTALDYHYDSFTSHFMKHTELL